MFAALEAARQGHEDIERLLRLGADALALSTGNATADPDGIPENHPARRSARAAEHLAVGLADAASLRYKALKDGNEIAGCFVGADAPDAKNQQPGSLGGDDSEGVARDSGAGSDIPPIAGNGESATDKGVDEPQMKAQKLADGAGKVDRVDNSRETEGPILTKDPAAALSEFYEQLRELKAVHKGEADEGWNNATANAALVASIKMPPDFSGEEGGGRYLDLQDHYATFVNLLPRVKPGGKLFSSAGEGLPPKVKKRARPTAESKSKADGKADPPKMRIEYLEYVKKSVSDHSSVPPVVRGSRAYEHYLEALLEYLVSFADRLHPLSHVRRLVNAAEATLRNDLRTRLASIRERFADAAAMLGAIGANGVRDELLMLGLKCGGRPEDRAARLWLAAQRAAAAPSEATGDADGIGRRVILEGLVVFCLEEMLAEELRRTVLNVEKKQSLSWVELEAERVAEEAVAERDERNDGDTDNEGDEEKPLYNPKDVPLGWDGKPIPFWLYKLHGLNHEFRCEICGNNSYKGPRAFERHFTDPQHVHGLRCLGISYSRDYFMVTRIADATKLRDNILRKTQLRTFDADAEEEFEDENGNVLNRKTYLDSKRQGLL